MKESFNCLRGGKISIIKKFKKFIEIIICKKDFDMCGKFSMLLVVINYKLPTLNKKAVDTMGAGYISCSSKYYIMCFEKR